MGWGGGSMQKDFHYDVVFALAKEAGYDSRDANTNAYASEYVDDNTDRQYGVSDDDGEFYVGFPEKIGKTANLYFPIITQAVDITSFQIEIQRYVYAPFHFIPGDNTVEIRDRKNPLCTTRGCKNAENLLTAALKSKDLYKIGVALHGYADTWSHERFSGFHEDWNRVYETISLKSLLPNIGHAELINKPDEISATWVDERFGDQKIDNRERAVLAAEQIFGFLKQGDVSWKDVRSTFEEIMGAQNYSDRVKLVKKLYPQIETYDQDRWIKEALKFERDPSEIPKFGEPTGAQPTRPRFVEVSVKDSNAHWFRFQEAAKKHLGSVLSSVSVI
jgi:hypothetical protein